MIDIGVQEGFVDKAGAWYSYNGERIGQGKDNVRNFLKENPDMADQIEAQIRQARLGDTAVVAETEAEEVEVEA